MPDKPEPKKPEIREEKPTPKDNVVETKHTVTIGGREIKYTVTTGTMVLKEETPDREKESEGEKPRAQIFFIAYTKDGGKDRSKRPLTFSFNGGPGSASVWLHLGVLGPRRVVLEFDGTMPRPPFPLTDNEFSLLDETDLVFIDPVSTGYSRPVEGQKPVEWHGYRKDIASVADFIRLYTTRNNRWLSPKFLIGESYGTTRAAGLSEYLYDHYGMMLNGIMLVSSILDFGTADFTPGNDMPYILFVPAYAATAWYHDAVKSKHQTLQEFLKEAEEFALGEYATALLKGDALTADERTHIVERLSHFTGISPTFIERSNLRILDQHFFKELLRERGLSVGRLDSRFTGRDRLGVTEFADTDAMMSNIVAPYTAAFYDYVRAELKFESDLKYVVSGWQIVNPWSFAEFEGRNIYVSESLRKAMTVNPHLKVIVLNGYYDLGTPYFATEYTFNHLGLHESLRSNLSMTYYEAGHMMYIHQPSLEAMKRDLSDFIKSAMP